MGFGEDKGFKFLMTSSPTNSEQSNHSLDGSEFNMVDVSHLSIRSVLKSFSTRFFQ